ncbi:spermidine synthase [Thermosyntropha lipolytica DSM 11003]|uniref:Polyamine aminopropyltransferase n=1 Tax=Thermosyntropha lipolytica DSM 11003 TaxID=1123382 RepID=A0A1M5NCI8_9FIRM|nr:polyamine aminopropyltransferase [Thermosyntropha lipolytica]SHG87240.1 spermidine synthase [Thermosyntropha lipolytica DSM 11003]
MELWVTEYQTPNLGFSCRVKATLRNEKTPFQHLAVVETEQFGRMLLLDGMVMTTDVDEYVYHEMITQVALNSHPHPEKVLIIGGGDGGALREVVNHPKVKKGTLVEIDERVIQAARDFFPALACSFDHPKAEVIVDDGVKFVKEHKNTFDVILVDSTEPVGPAVELFSQNFYRDVYEALCDDGMLVVQSESPFYNRDVIKMAFTGIKNVFPVCKLYLASIPTYPSGLWSFTVGSKKYDPEEVSFVYENPQLKYYSPEVHKAVFKLPPFVKKIVEGDE